MLYPVSHQEILALINASNPGSPLKDGDLKFNIVGQQADGTTTVEVTPADGVPYYGKRVITYRKRDLAKSVLGVPVRLLVTQNVTIRTLIEMFAAKYGYTFTEAMDFAQTELDKEVDFAQSGVQVVEIPAADTSLVWIGKLSISVSNDALDLTTIIANNDLSELKYLSGDASVASIKLATTAGDFSSLSSDIGALNVGDAVPSALASAIVAAMTKQGIILNSPDELGSALTGQLLASKETAADQSQYAKFTAVNNNAEWAGGAVLFYGKRVVPTEPETNVMEFTVEQGHVYINLGPDVKATVRYGDGLSTSTNGSVLNYDYPIAPTGNLVITVDMSTVTPDTVLQVGGNAIKTCVSWVNHVIAGVRFGDSTVANAATRLTKVPATLPSSFRKLDSMFWGCNSFNGAEVEGWDTSRITSLNSTFRNTANFNRDISNWDVSNVTDMTQTFTQAAKFNQPIGKWNTAKVNLLNSTFMGAAAFNQDLSNWKTGNVTGMASLFSSATAFNGNISTWDTSKVTTMYGIFQSSAFNGNISGWNTGNVTEMSRLARNNTVFNQNLSGWNVSKVATHTDFDAGATAWTAGNKPVWVI